MAFLKGFRPSASRRSGVTLIEIMMGASILAMLFFVSYRLFSSFTRTQEVGHWAATTTKQLRNGLTLLRNELSRATKPEIVTQKGSEPSIPAMATASSFSICPTLSPSKPKM
ncbi:hypothetical protein MASR1M12_40100 [Erysipelotrichia bacterium]